MTPPFAGALLCAAFLLLVLATATLFRKSRAAALKREAEETARYAPRIERFFSDFDRLASAYISIGAGKRFEGAWRGLYKELRRKRFSPKNPAHGTIKRFLEAFADLEAKTERRNERFVQNESRRHDAFFSDIDGKSLDIQQRTAVVCDEDRTLVLAGAGSGKTLTIAAKAAYLCNIKNVNPQEILLISFTKKSADEMTERIQGRLGIPVRATTFHKLGLDILKGAFDFRPDVFDDLDGFVRRFFDEELLRRPELTRILTEYFAYYLEVPPDMNGCESLGELYEKEKSADLESLKSKYERNRYVGATAEQNARRHASLKGERMKSLEETKIANFLFLNGVEYEYEALYPYESGDPYRKAYRPDFYLPGYGIYLEHFGINREGKTPWLSEIEEEKYLQGIEWKRGFHKKNGTTLLETYSYYSSEGVLLEKLEETLSAAGVVFSPRDFPEIFNTVYAKMSGTYVSEFIRLCCTFITLLKSGGRPQAELERVESEVSATSSPFFRRRGRLFLAIIRTVMDEYQRHLDEHNAVDFSDMIHRAADSITAGLAVRAYKYIIVDEYQDISRARFRLLQAIAETTGAKIFCVGDDWQSIYRFAGADISLFTDFETHLGAAKTLKIERTYRNAQQLLDEASAFVLKNPSQLEKRLVSEKSLNHPLVFWGYDKEPHDALHHIMEKIISEFGAESSILLLGRNNHDIGVLKKSDLFRLRSVNGVEQPVFLPSPKTPLTFLSVHKSKGLEADNVVLLNFKNDTLGFPNQIADDRLLGFVLPKAERHPFAEERRLFYVAITRTKNRVFVLTDNKAPSVFFSEFSPSDRVRFVQTGALQNENTTLCPKCKTGFLLKVAYGTRHFVGCSNFPKCTYTLNDLSVLANPTHCPDCGGFLIKRRAANGHWFIGCTNYPHCTHTEPL